MPSEPSTIQGKLYDLDGAIVTSATITLTKGTSVLTITSNSAGEYSFNLGNFSSWSVGDSATLACTVTGKGTISESITLEKGSTYLDLTLVETSNLTYTETAQNVHNLVFVVPTLFDGTKVNNSNPLPVKADSMLTEPALTNTYDSKNRLSTQTITVGGIDYKRTFTYSGTNFQFITRSAWVRQ